MNINSMKRLLILIILFCSLSLFSQESTSVKVLYAVGKKMVNGKSVLDLPSDRWTFLQTTNLKCFKFLEIKIYVKQGVVGQKVKYKVEITNKSPFGVQLNNDFDFPDFDGFPSIEPGGTASRVSNDVLKDYPILTISRVEFYLTSAEQEKYGAPKYSGYLDCSETPQSYLAKIKLKKEKEDKIRRLKGQISLLGDTKEDLFSKIALYKQLYELDKSSNYYSRISSYEDRLRRLEEELAENKKEIESLQNKINNSGNSKEGLEIKKNCYRKLQDIDKNNDYSKDISYIDRKIEEEKVREKELAEKTASSSSKSVGYSNSNSSDDFWKSSKTSSNSLSTTSGSTSNSSQSSYEAEAAARNARSKKGTDLLNKGINELNNGITLKLFHILIKQKVMVKMLLFTREKPANE